MLWLRFISCSLLCILCACATQPLLEEEQSYAVRTVTKSTSNLTSGEEFRCELAVVYEWNEPEGAPETWLQSLNVQVDEAVDGVVSPLALRDVFQSGYGRFIERAEAQVRQLDWVASVTNIRCRFDELTEGKLKQMSELEQQRLTELSYVERSERGAQQEQNAAYKPQLLEEAEQWRVKAEQTQKKLDQLKAELGLE